MGKFFAAHSTRGQKNSRPTRYRTIISQPTPCPSINFHSPPPTFSSGPPSAMNNDLSLISGGIDGAVCDGIIMWHALVKIGLVLACLFNFNSLLVRIHLVKGTTINDLGVGPEEIEKKNFGGPSPGKSK